MKPKLGPKEKEAAKARSQPVSPFTVQAIPSPVVVVFLVGLCRVQIPLCHYFPLPQSLFFSKMLFGLTYVTVMLCLKH